ncbi:GntR family transcriptional regulator [Rhizosaccharibacter radicis]|uniref:GntR family transcriptional regulator n=1 Tax=Rhizosaccharibacter radicis TaxID=2782605 RepID=A0ABT1W117_9PROT|nr:GntR family transcriptional regulator [Acetobacteraceae bacterium KSS12]
MTSGERDDGVSRNSATALYLQIATHIAARIGRDPAFMDRLPSESELVARYAVSRITVRQALDHLVRRGLVVRRQGRGTFVTEPREQRTTGPAKGLADILAAQGLSPETTLLALEAADAPAEIQQALALSGPRSLFLRRRYSVEGRDAALTEVYYPPSCLGAFGWEDARRHSSLDLLSRFAGIQIGRSDSVIQVRTATEELRRHLDIETQEAVMMIRRVTFSVGGEPCEYSTLYAKAGIAEFAVTTNGEEEAGHLRPRAG